MDRGVEEEHFGQREEREQRGTQVGGKEQSSGRVSRLVRPHHRV